MESQWGWLWQLDERQIKEVQLAQVYAEQFAHGTDGHHRLLLIAKLVEILVRRSGEEVPPLPKV